MFNVQFSYNHAWSIAFFNGVQVYIYNSRTNKAPRGGGKLKS